MIALGIVSSPNEVEARVHTRIRLAPHSEFLRFKFVLGNNIRLNESDIAYVNVRDGTRFSCAGKTYEWYRRALELFPQAKYVAKADDDTFLFPSRLRAILTNAPTRNVYMGNFLSASFRTDHMSLCYGNCTVCHGAKCVRSIPRGVIGPYPFATGAFHALSRDVVPRLRMTREDEIWCAHEDAAFGMFIWPFNVTRKALRVVDVQELYANPRLDPVAVHRVRFNEKVYIDRARRERIKNVEFVRRGIPKQFHLKILKETNHWFVHEYLKSEAGVEKI